MPQIDSESKSEKELSELVIQGMLDKKAIDIRVFDLRGIKHAVSDFLIICSGNSDTQIDSISQSVEAHVAKTARQKPWNKEGHQNREWIILDYVNVVAHIFNKERREFYGLEELWADAKIQNVEENNRTLVVE